MGKFSIGIDFGTQSGRAVLVDLQLGVVRAASVFDYPGGVIDTFFPGSTSRLPDDWALQNPLDWLKVVENTLPDVLKQAGVSGEDVVGIGMDFTASTVLPADVHGQPLSMDPRFAHNPHAWCKLWKHHAAQPYADQVTRLALELGENWIKRYGGKISSEWLLPKALQILNEAPQIYAAASYILEAADWVAWQLTGSRTRNTCTAGYKGLWHKQEGFPSTEFLKKLNPQISSLYSGKVAGEMAVPGTKIGGLTAEWAQKTGLPLGMPVSASIIDAHAAVLGSGVSGPGQMVLAMGTSTCHLVMDEEELPVEGIAGVVQDGIVPDLYGYEAGQSAVGDIFAWFIENNVPADYQAQAKKRGISLHELLSEKATVLKAGQTGLIALDWWNGNRSTLMDANLSGLVIGYNLLTRPEEVYRALLEATAFGTRAIIDAFTSQGVAVDSIMAGGGLTRNPLLMQIYADVLGRNVFVAGSDQAAALGAAMLGAVAAGKEAGGYESIAEAVEQIAPPPARVYTPLPDDVFLYDELYQLYLQLYDHFGRGAGQLMKKLRNFRN